MASLRSDRKTFRQPGTEFRPWVHWLWNDHLDADALRSQLEQLADAGFGRAIVHGYPGLEAAAYLSDEWFTALGVVLGRARKRGLQIGVADEFGWPTGHGGAWLARNPEHLAYRLEMDDFVAGEAAPELRREDIVAAFAAAGGAASRGTLRQTALTVDTPRFEAVKLQDVTALQGRRVVLFRVTRAAGRLNLLSAGSVRAFVEYAYGAYRSQAKRYLGNTLDLVYSTDLHLHSGPSSLPWDPELAGLFREARGYDPIPHLPELFFDLPECEAFRYHFWTLVGEVFREGLPASIRYWCDDSKMKMAGNFGVQPALKEAARNTGGLMPLYAQHDRPTVCVPGCGTIGDRNFEEYAQAVVALKQAASVADQFGKGGAVAESFAFTGPGMRLDCMRTAALFCMALGVRHVMHHAAPASTRGDRKIETPPLIHASQPWWRFAPEYTDCLSRASWLLSQGKRRCNVLLLLPMASVQAAYRHPRTEPEMKYGGYLFEADLPFETVDKHLALLSCALLDHQIDFHYGDEELLARGGRAEHKRLVVGEQPYDLVILPPLTNLRSSTLDLLQDYASSGGHVIQAGSTARLIDGRESDAAARFIDEYALRVVDGIDHFDYSGVVAAAQKLGGRTIEFTTDDGPPRDLRVHQRRWDDREILFLLNSGAETIQGTLEYVPPSTGRLESWQLESGECDPIALCTAEEAVHLPLGLAPGEAWTLVCAPRETKADVAPALQPGRAIAAEWTGRRLSPNTLVLTRCRFGEHARLRSVGEARRLLYKEIRRLGQPARVAGRFPFQVSPMIPWTEKCRAAIELPDDAEVFFNGEPLVVNGSGTVEVDLPELRLGENELEVRGVYTDAWDFEAPRILGEFEVTTPNNVAFVVEFSSQTLSVGPWCERGMPFYAGGVAYTAELSGPIIGDDERVTIELPRLIGAAEVRVNGVVQPRMLWAPFRCDITDAWNNERTMIEVDVFNTLRNTVGPHFAPPDECRMWYERAHYEGEAAEALVFAKEGLLQAPIIRTGGTRSGASG